MNSPALKAKHILIIGLLLVIFLSNITLSDSQQKKQVTLNAILEDQGDPERWNSLLQRSMQELNAKHPDLDIHINYTTYPYNETRDQLLKAMSDNIPVDLITVDQIWLGEFAEKGLLADLSNYTQTWDRSSDWYEINWDGGAYNDRIYGIWAWADARGMWYWKDLIQKAGVDPESLRTWDGYIASAKKLNEVLRPQGLEGVHLVAASHSPDMSFYPYLWMLGGAIVESRPGHPTQDHYWFPSYNSTEGVKALEFIKDQIEAGIKPQKEHFWGKEFLDRKFAVMLEALQHHIPPPHTPENKKDFEQKVGFMPLFPMPYENHTSATLMGGWLLSIPESSEHKDLAWELITTILEPKILAPYLAAHANLPTQIPIGEGNYSTTANATIPYYEQLISMIEIAHTRPSIPEYPEISEHIKQAIDEVMYGIKEPKQALDEAAAKSAKVLGW
ncbi:MAG: extracellular solute-binding protein [Nitrososphaeraceae archaeon]